ncbi:DUF6294 family protein [Streptomyces sp. NPDC028722]|uniref:DUF6294 family protein n=1 Tax=Streptomyces sp. NPDC028722 TaxID=3155016 RepID=UPI0033E6F7E8
MQRQGDDVRDEYTGGEQDGVPQMHGPARPCACGQRQGRLRVVFRVGPLVPFDECAYGGLRLYAGGRLTFSARTRTDFTLSGDVWHARFELKNSADQGLFTTSTCDSPTMWASRKHDWTANGTYEPSDYDATAKVTRWASC